MRATPAGPSRWAFALIALLVFAAGLVADQVTKAWALSALADGEVISLLPGVSLQLAFNPGIAFGMGAEFGPIISIGILLVLVSLMGWVIWSIYRGRASGSTLLLTAVASGGVGNMIDRISRSTSAPFSGSVVDFLAVEWFAIFNIADVLAVAGVAAWALSLGGRPRPEPSRQVVYRRPSKPQSNEFGGGS